MFLPEASFVTRLFATTYFDCSRHSPPRISHIVLRSSTLFGTASLDTSSDPSTVHRYLNDRSDGDLTSRMSY